MAAQDLIISRRQTGNSPYLDSESGSDGTTDALSVLMGILRKRWLLLGVVAAASIGLATLVMWQFGKNRAAVKTTLMYTGMPTPISQGFDPLGPATGAEMIVSGRVLDQLCRKRNLDVPPALLADLLKTSIGRSSALLNVTLTWNDASDAVTVLNDLNSLFIEEMAAQRKVILRDHLQHLDMSLLQAKMRVDDARQQVDTLRRQQEANLTKGGLTSDQYRQALTSVTNTNSSIDETKTEQLGISEQIDQITKSIEEVAKKQQDLEHLLRHDILRETEATIRTARDRHAPGSPSAREIGETIDRVSKILKADAEAPDFNRWLKNLQEIMHSESNGLSKEDHAKLEKTMTELRQEHEADFRNLTNQQQQLEHERSQMRLRMIPLKNQIAMLEQRKKDYEKQALKLSEQITGVSATQVDEAEHRLDEAERQRDVLAVQSDGLRQLESSKLREWTVSVPASLDTATQDSNHAKLFVLVFGLCGVLFSAPIFVAEWRSQTGSAPVRFARSLRVPVLAERVLEHFAPQQRRAAAELPAEHMELIRMVTLRIQQSCHRPGSVVVFTSLDATVSAAPLMAKVAECLAEREERVLLVDAMSPERTLLPGLHHVSHALTAHTPEHHNQLKPISTNQAKPPALPGLSEYLSEECEAVSDLIRPTGYPGVDLISSGGMNFPREAMASSCLTELLNTCRRSYTVILVHGPAADCAADLQMLTARADGIVLATTKRVSRDNRIREAVQDLLDLGAPIIGVVA